jgi:hypothetical protein
MIVQIYQERIMSKAGSEKTTITLHTSCLVEERDYLMRLAANPHLCASKKPGEIFSIGVIAFLARRPFDSHGWSWIRPQGVLTTVGGQRVANSGWVNIHPKLMDIELDARRVTAEQLLREIEKIAAGLERRTAADTGMSQVIYSCLQWTLTKLYPAEIYDVSMLPRKVSGDMIEKVFWPKTRIESKGK